MQLASEIKVCIISFHNTLQGMCPYFALIGFPQTINESNDFYTTVLKACYIYATQARNVVPLNVSTDVVAFEVHDNLILIIKYLNGEINYVTLVDTNHNINNLRYQLLGGLLPAFLVNMCLTCSC